MQRPLCCHPRPCSSSRSAPALATLKYAHRKHASASAAARAAHGFLLPHSRVLAGQLHLVAVICCQRTGSADVGVGQEQALAVRTCNRLASRFGLPAAGAVVHTAGTEQQQQQRRYGKCAAAFLLGSHRSLVEHPPVHVQACQVRKIWCTGREAAATASHSSWRVLEQPPR